MARRTAEVRSRDENKTFASLCLSRLFPAPSLSSFIIPSKVVVFLLPLLLLHLFLLVLLCSSFFLLLAVE